MKEGVKKRALSPVIASVLLILLVLVLAAIIFLWARGFIGEQIEKFGKPIEQICEDVSFEAYRDGSELEVVNKGNVDIRSLDIRMTKGGDSEVSNFNFQVDAGDSARGYITFEMSDGSTPESLIAYPTLVGNVQGAGSNSLFTCINSGVTL